MLFRQSGLVSLCGSFSHSFPTRPIRVALRETLRAESGRLICGARNTSRSSRRLSRRARRNETTTASSSFLRSGETPFNSIAPRTRMTINQNYVNTNARAEYAIRRLELVRVFGRAIKTHVERRRRPKRRLLDINGRFMRRPPRLAAIYLAVGSLRCFI